MIDLHHAQWVSKIGTMKWNNTHMMKTFDLFFYCLRQGPSLLEFEGIQ